MEAFQAYTLAYTIDPNDSLMPKDSNIDLTALRSGLAQSLLQLREKRNQHPELFGVRDETIDDNAKSLLDALYEEGIIPIYLKM